ncbi:HpcH/HpaI aldolase/citrate lyase family protein [Corynebacterium terpenotabidum]|uniref:Citrate lyase n=1 Tax=Corynebacterium terpenotabidum Y-11 TaxID=1200352 RepID=S4XL53_9CORY|nr:CoA ester lyase [Corynebacterium terpenotabidum]AGP31323.1 citrate lyase [Corynebacterium terpenotabidum Y-11]
MTGRWTPPGPALLFAPADRPERFAKAAGRADAVILDLEDGCRAENRAHARQHIIDAAASLDPARTIIRINPPGTPDFDADIRAVAASGLTTVMLPKAEGAASVEALPEIAPEAATWRIIALVETPRGVLELASLASHPQVDALFWGAEDLTAALGGTASRYSADETPTVGGGASGHPGGYREVPRLTRSLVLLHAAAAGKAALDSIHADTSDVAGARAEAVDAAASGFSATVAIHPGLVPVIREAYSPDPDSIDWARRVVAGAAENSGAFTVDGQMIDAPLRRQAELILARVTTTDRS